MTRAVRVLLAVIGLLALSVGCSTEGAQQGEVVSDSSGVRCCPGSNLLLLLNYFPESLLYRTAVCRLRRGRSGSNGGCLTVPLGSSRSS